MFCSSNRNIVFDFFHQCCVAPNEIFLHIIPSLFDSNPRNSHTKVQRVNLWSKQLAPQWQASNCYKTRSSSLPSRRGLICGFHSYFLKRNDNKSSLRKVPWLEWPFPLRLPGIKVVSILDRDGVMSRLAERCSLLQTRNCGSTTLQFQCDFRFQEVFMHLVSSFLFHCHVVM